MNTRQWLTSLLVILAVSAAGGFAYTRLRPTTAAKLPVVAIRQGEFLVSIRCRGELIAQRSAQITAPTNVPELRIVWQAPASSAVKAGEVVIRFDPSSAQRQLQEKEAVLHQSTAALDQAIAQARITEEEDKRELSAAVYAVEKARLEVSKAEIVSRLQGEESRVDLGLAEQKLRVQAATAGLHAAAHKAKIAALARAREQAQAEVDLNKRRLERMELKAPIDGIIVYLSNFSQGWQNAKPFKVGDQVWPGAAVAEVPDLATIGMEGRIEEIDRGKIAIGADVRVKIDSLPELPLPASLTSITPLTQMSFEWPPTSSFRGIASLQRSDSRLRPAMNGSMEVVISRLANAMSIPAKAVFTREGRPVVYLENKNRYERHSIRIVARSAEEVAIEGLPAGGKVTLVEPDVVE